MMEFENEALMIARGKFATVRGKHEDAKAQLAKLTGELASLASRVCRQMQPDNDQLPDNVDALLITARHTIDLMESCAKSIEDLARQRQELRKEAWR